MTIAAQAMSEAEQAWRAVPPFTLVGTRPPDGTYSIVYRDDHGEGKFLWDTDGWWDPLRTNDGRLCGAWPWNVYSHEDLVIIAIINPSISDDALRVLCEVGP